MRDEDLTIMGFIRGAHGIRGWLKVHADTQHADSLFDFPVWYLGKQGNWQPYTFQDGAVQPKQLVAQLEGVTDRDMAEALRGCQVAVPRAELPPTEDDEYYWTDLIGLAVVNQRGESLGSVQDLMETGANDVLVVRGEHGQCLIPFVSAYVTTVDMAGKQITVEWELDY